MIKILSSDAGFNEAVAKHLEALQHPIEARNLNLEALVPTLDRSTPDLLLIHEQYWLNHEHELTAIKAKFPYLQTIIIADESNAASGEKPGSFSIQDLPIVLKFAILQSDLLVDSARREAYYRSAFENNTDPIVTVSLDEGWILDANQIAVEFFGYTKTKLVGSYIQLLFDSPSQWEKLKQSILEYPTQQANQIIGQKLKNGMKRIADVTASYIKWEGTDAAICILHDITQIVRERESLDNQRATLLEMSDEYPLSRRDSNDDLTQAEESLRLLTVLAQIELAINQSLELDSALNEMNIIVTQALSLGLGVCIILPESETNKYILHSSNIPGLQNITPYSLGPEDSLAIENILQSKDILIAEDISFSPYEKSPFVEEFGVMSGCGLPLLVEEKIIGILFVLDTRPRHYSENEINFLTALANRVGMAITKVQLYQSLQNAKETAEFAARNRAEYLASMSHELRAPLAAINNLSDLLSATHLTHQQSDYLASIKSSTDHLLALLNDILDFSRLEASRLELKEKEFSVIQVIESALNLVAIPASQKNLDLSYIIDEDVPETLVGDPNRLRQVLTNLLTNAIKFTEIGHITVEAHRQAKHLSMVAMIDSEIELRFTVTDTGIGISKVAQKDLFKPFSQLENPELNVKSGSGLGLSICKQIVQLMGGNLWVDSSGINGEGSSFSFTIQSRIIYAPPSPYFQNNLEPLMGKQVAVIGSSSLSLNRAIHWLTHWGMTVTHFEAVKELQFADSNSSRFDLVIIDDRCILPKSENLIVRIISEWKLKRNLPVILFVAPNTQRREIFRVITTNTLHWPLSLPRFYHSLIDTIQFSKAATRPQTFDPNLEILLVDDDIVNLAAVQLHLDRLGYSADTVPNGYEALKKLERTRYDLVIMDMRMEAMDGYETTRTIRETFPQDAQPIIAILTAGVSPNQLNALQSAGMDAYIEKPINADQLTNLLELALHQRQGDVIKSIPNEMNPTADKQTSINPTGINPIVLRNLLKLSPSDHSADNVGFLELFNNTAPNLLQEAQKAVNEKKVDALKDALHALRGTCEIYGAQKLSELCRQLELGIDQALPEDIEIRMGEIAKEFKSAKTEIQHYIEEPARLDDLTK